MEFYAAPTCRGGTDDSWAGLAAIQPQHIDSGRGQQERDRPRGCVLLPRKESVPPCVPHPGQAARRPKDQCRSDRRGPLRATATAPVTGTSASTVTVVHKSPTPFCSLTTASGRREGPQGVDVGPSSIRPNAANSSHTGEFTDSGRSMARSCSVLAARIAAAAVEIGSAAGQRYRSKQQRGWQLISNTVNNTSIDDCGIRVSCSGSLSACFT